MKELSLAHSPDADDIFMYYAVKYGWVPSTSVAFTNEAQDIETLNVNALAGLFDVTAVSFALYPHIRDSYALLRTAVSFGDGYGPKLIRRRGERLKRRFKVALSGRYTTNALLFRIAYPDARITYMNFLEIEAAVREGTVDAGVLIHESILDFDASLEVERELWDVWQALCGEPLPLPLGGMAIRRSLPLGTAIEAERVLTEAVRTARLRKAELSERLLQEHLVRIDAPTLGRYLELYANDDSVELSALQYRAIRRLFALGHEHGFYDQAIDPEEFTIPREYEALRHS